MIQIFDAPRTGFDFLAEDAPKLGASIAELVAKIKKSKQISEMAKQMAEKSGNPEMAKLYEMAAKQNPNKLFELLQKGNASQGAPMQDSQGVFNEMAGMVKNNESGIGIDPFTAMGFNRQGVQNRARFDTMRGKMEATLLPMVNKGSLAKERFKYIMSLIPESNDSQRAIVGKLQGLASALNLDPAELEGIFGEAGQTQKAPQFQEGEQVKKLPSAAQHKGAMFEAPGGVKYKSNGKSWIRSS